MRHAPSVLTCRDDGGGDGDARLTEADGDGASDDASGGGDDNTVDDIEEDGSLIVW